MPKFPEQPFVISSLQETARAHGLNHLRARKHGDLIILESGPKTDPVRHIRLRRATRQWYTLEIAKRAGRWEPVPFVRAPAKDVFETVIHNFPWVLTPLD